MNTILASKSPRRAKILSDHGWIFTVEPTEAEEVSIPRAPKRTVLVNAARKLKACREAHPDAEIVAADTIVWFNGRIYGNKHDIYGVTIESTSRSRLNNGLFGSFGENAYIERVNFVDITHVIDLQATAQDATFGLLAGNAQDGAKFKNVTVSGKLVFGDSCASLVDGSGYTIKTIIADGDTSGITAGEILAQKQNAENNAFELKTDEDGTVYIVSAGN